MTWQPSPPIEFLCTVCGKRHGTPACKPRSPLIIDPALFADLADKEKK